MIKSTLGIILLTTLYGCASTQQITLSSDELKPLKQYAKVTSVTTDGFSVDISKVTDLRENQRHVGQAYTGFTDKKTDIDFNLPLESLVKEQLKMALKQRGIGISTSGEYTLNAEIEKFWLEEITTGLGPREYECEVKMNFNLNTKAQVKSQWSGSFWSKITSGTQNQTGLDKKTATIASCLNQVVEKLIRDKLLQSLTQMRIK